MYKELLLDWLNRIPRKITNTLNADYHVKLHHADYKHDLGKQIRIHSKQQHFPQSIKCLTNSYQQHPCDIEN